MGDKVCNANIQVLSTWATKYHGGPLGIAYFLSHGYQRRQFCCSLMKVVNYLFYFIFFLFIKNDNLACSIYTAIYVCEGQYL
jgi:hypothetical protein